jgi:hypothetical protein
MEWLLKLRVGLVFRPARNDKLHKVRTRTIIKSGFMGSILSIGPFTGVSRVVACRLAVALPERPSPKQASQNTSVMFGC